MYMKCMQTNGHKIGGEESGILSSANMLQQEMVF